MSSLLSSSLLNRTKAFFYIFLAQNFAKCLKQHHNRTNGYQYLQNQTDTILKQLQGVCNMVSIDDYTKKLPVFYNASIGGHVRHILDHFNQVLITSYSHVESNQPSIILQYDVRSRNTDVENDKVKAFEQCNTLLFQNKRLFSNKGYSNKDLVDQTCQIDETALNVNSIDDSINLFTNVHVEFMSNGKGDSYQLSSNIGRELSFVTHHGVHHLSTIKLMMESIGYEITDETIGLASSTQQHQHSQKH